MTPGRVYDIAVVGAGQSGMACAYELHKLGVGSFIVIEARDRVGGRTVTQALGDGPWPTVAPCGSARRQPSAPPWRWGTRGEQ